MLALAPSTMKMVNGDAAAFRGISDLVNSLPTFWLELGRDLDRIPETIEMLLRSIPEPAKRQARS